MCPPTRPRSELEAFIEIMQSPEMEGPIRDFAEGHRQRMVVEADKFENAAADTVALRSERATS